jgi:IrrE N-terminal-like domain
VNRTQYYSGLKELARQTRADYGLMTPRVLRSDLRRIYKDCGIQIDLRTHTFKGLRGAYFNDEYGPSVLLPRGLPDEPTIFTMGHELKHHLTDQDKILSYCSDSNQDDLIEKGAEVFAAELIFPDQDLIDWFSQMGIGRGACTPERLVTLKHETRTTLSYAGLEKKTRFLGFASPSFPANSHYKKLEEQIYGEPSYKRILRYRRATQSP